VSLFDHSDQKHLLALLGHHVGKVRQAKLLRCPPFRRWRSPVSPWSVRLATASGSTAASSRRSAASLARNAASKGAMNGHESALQSKIIFKQEDREGVR